MENQVEDAKINKPLLPIEAETAQAIDENRPKIWVFVIIGVLILGLLIAGTVFLLTSEASVTSKIRDIFIIFMALESLVIGVALVVLVVQIAILTNLLQNEIKPILDTTNETVSTLKGTVRFLSDNLSEPVIVLNEYLAAIKRLMEIIRPRKR